MMDCLRAQQLISDALDRVPVDAQELTSAKTHCRECDDCAAFVRSLLVVERAGLPDPPAELTTGIMAAVRAEAAQGSEAKAPLAGAPPAGVSDDEGAARAWGDLLARARHPRNRRAVLTWVAAAAVVFVAAGIGALAGVRAILVPPQAGTYESAGTSALDAAAPKGSAPSLESDGQRESDTAQPSQTIAPSFISVNATVYRFTGPAPDVDTDTLTPLGSVRTNLGEPGAPSDYEVLGTSDGASAYVQNGDGVLVFQRVTRSFGGRLYVLQSGPIESFGTWPDLPPGFRQPRSEDGSPVFEEAGTDENGTVVYDTTDTPVEQGIGIGPNPPPSDPIAGSPEWTWWTVAP